MQEEFERIYALSQNVQNQEKQVFSATAEEILSDSGRISSAMDVLMEATGRINARMDDMARNAETISAVMDDAFRRTNENASGMEALGRELGGFRL